MRWAVIRNAESDANAAVLVHDRTVGRIVCKVRSADWPLQRSFDIWVDRPLVVHEPKNVGSGLLTVRRKLTRFDPRYLDHMLDRFVKRPYAVRTVQETDTTLRLDQFADRKAAETIADQERRS